MQTSKSLWDSDESEAEGVGGHRDSDSDYAPSQEGGDHCRRSKRNIVNKYVSSSAAAREAAVLNELDAGLGVSSWGRLRKRRIIPNNIEDQGMSSSKKMRSQYGGSSSRYDSPLGRDSPASQSSSSSAYRGRDERSLRPPPELRNDSTGSTRSATAASSTSNARTSVNSASGATLTSQESSGRTVRMPWDQAQQLGVARMPGSDTLYVRSRPLPMTANANAQMVSSPRPLLAGRLVSPVQQPVTQAAVRGRIMNTPTLLRTAANSSNTTGRVQPAPVLSVDGHQLNSSSLKVIMPSSAAPAASTTAPVRMVLPGGVNVLVKPTAKLPSGASPLTARPSGPTFSVSSQLQKNLSGGANITLPNIPPAEASASSALNLLAGTAAQLPQLGGSAVPVSPRVENDARFNNDNAETDDSISPQSKSGVSSPTKSPLSKTVRQLLGSPGDAVAASSANSVASSSSAAHGVPVSLGSKIVNAEPKVSPPAVTGVRPINRMLLTAPALQAQVRPGAVTGLQAQKVVMQPAQTGASALLPQQVKQVQLTDSSGNVIFMTPQQLQKAMEAMRKNTAIDNAIRKVITTAVSTTLPTAQIKVTAGVSPLDQPSHKPYRPVTVVTSATKTPVAAVPQALSSVAAEKQPLASSALQIKGAVSLGGHLTSSPLLNGTAAVRSVNAAKPVIAASQRLANSPLAKVQLQQPGAGGFIDLQSAGNVSASTRPLVAASLSQAPQTLLVQQAAGNVMLGQNVMVSAQPLLVQQQPQQQQVLLLAGGLQTVVPVVIGSSLAANSTLSLVADNGIQQQSLVLSPVSVQQQGQAVDIQSLAAAKRLPLVANASSSSVKIVQQFSSTANGQQQANSDGALSVNLSSVNGVPSQQQQQHYALINLNGQLIAAPTAGILHNQIVPGAGK